MYKTPEAHDILELFSLHPEMATIRFDSEAREAKVRKVRLNIMLLVACFLRCLEDENAVF